MEWVETTGPTVDAALDAALDELGVHEEEVEFEVLQEPKSGLFGRLGGNPARIRARVKPISREKPGERNRNRGGRPPRGNGGRGGSGSGSGSGGAKSRNGRPSSASRGGGTKETRVSKVDEADAASEDRPERANDNEPQSGDATAKAGNRRRRRGRGRGGSGGGQRPQEESDVTTTAEEEVPIGEQADVADEFMRGLIGAFGMAARVSVRIEEDVVLVDVEGEDLGLLVGPKGATLRAIEDLVRTVVQRRTDGHGARIHVDVGGYQARRREALAKFAADLANRVAESGQELALEPMPPGDRKVVHDTVSEIAGVVTISEGEEPRRRVVLRPA